MTVLTLLFLATLSFYGGVRWSSHLREVRVSRLLSQGWTLGCLETKRFYAEVKPDPSRLQALLARCLPYVAQSLEQIERSERDVTAERAFLAELQEALRHAELYERGTVNDVLEWIGPPGDSEAEVGAVSRRAS